VSGAEADFDDEVVLSPLPTQFYKSLLVDFVFVLGFIYVYIVRGSFLVVLAPAFLYFLWRTWNCRKIPVSFSSKAISGPSIDLENGKLSRHTIPLSSIDRKRSRLKPRWWNIGQANYFVVRSCDNTSIMIHRKLYSKEDTERVLQHLEPREQAA
jgi:hypothetical protein